MGDKPKPHPNTQYESKCLTPQAKKRASYSVKTSNQKKKKQNDKRNVVELYKIFGALEGQDFDKDDTAYGKRDIKNKDTKNP